MCIGESWGDIWDLSCFGGPLQAGGGIWDSCLYLTRLLKCKSTIYVMHQQDHLLLSQLCPTFPPVWME